MTKKQELTIEEFEQHMRGSSDAQKQALKRTYRFNEEKQAYILQADKALQGDTESTHVEDDALPEGVSEDFQEQIESLEKNQEALQKRIQSYEETIKRQHAEFQNYKKRIEKEKEQIITTATQKLIESLLPIIDSFEKSIELSGDSDIGQFREGIKLIGEQIQQALRQHGLERIECIGEEFDPSKHEALQIDKTSKTHKENTIITEWQAGYFLNGKVIRHSKVVVAGPKESNTEGIKRFSKEEFDGILEQLEGKDLAFIKDSYRLEGQAYTFKEPPQQDTEKHKKARSIIENIKTQKKETQKQNK